MRLKKNEFVVGLICYVMWGILPAYWNLLSGVDPLLILCCRIVFSLVFTICLLLTTNRTKVFIETLKDKPAMWYLIPASVLITFNWGLYIWAVNNGHILDCSIGYYMNPLMVFLLGTIIFREKFTKLQIVAVILAFIGMLISVIAYGSFPYISISLSLSFSAYGVFKKKAGADPVSSIAVESMIITPFAILFSFLFLRDSIVSAGIVEAILLIVGGVLTAVPLVLYARAVNGIPFIIVGFFQYISPSLSTVYGILRGERPSASQYVSFIFIGLGLIVFSIALVLISKAEQKANAAPPVPSK